MRVLVTGSSGFVGSALRPVLRAAGHEVVRLVRHEPTQPDEVRWDPDAGTLDAARLEGVDAAVHLAGEGIGERRWTDEQKRRIRDSRERGTTLLAEALAGLRQRPSVLVSASGINWYGAHRGDEELTEGSTPGDGFLAEVCRLWEGATAPAESAGIRTVLLRTGIVLDASGGALARQLPLFRLGLGGPLGNGRNWWSWITLEDHVRLIVHALGSTSLTGPVNATAPTPVRNIELTKALGRALGRPAVLRVPRLGPTLLFGRQMVDEVVMSDLRVLPRRAEADGFTWQHPTIETAVQAIVG